MAILLTEGEVTMNETKSPSFLFSAVVVFASMLAVTLAPPGEILAQEPATSQSQKGATADSRQPPAAAQVQGVVAKASERERPPAPESGDRERHLLDRIEQLEQRLKQMETLVNPTAPFEKKAIDPVAPQPTTPAATASPEPGAKPGLPERDPAVQTPGHLLNEAWDKAGVKIVPFGVFVVNANFNSSTLVPGSFGLFALPDLAINQEQTNISPGNTYLGVDIKGGRVGQWEINGKVDFDLRGTTPTFANNVFQPQFINIYGEAKTDRYRILVGQTGDVVSPLIPGTLNYYPVSFAPGSLGYFRPQIRFEFQKAADNGYTYIFQGAIAQAIQTLQISDEVIGRQTGAPDGQLRFALAHGKPNPADPLQKRPFELGLSAHIGERRGTLLALPALERDFTTWSWNVDLAFDLGSKARVEGEFFWGSVLGDYAGGILQTFNPTRGNGIRAVGGWANLRYRVNEKWAVNGGYGIDDPNNKDLSFGNRSSNDMVYGNFFYSISQRLQFGLEFAHWRTRWVGLPTGGVFRIEPALIYFF